MLPDIRLDFIANIDPQFVDMMTSLRNQYMELDSKLRAISSLDAAKRDGVGRCLSIARTEIETALQYSIKALCLMGEIKP